jgi:hypothetical protein
MSAFLCADPDFTLVTDADIQADPAHPLDPVKLTSVRAAMRAGTPLPAVVLYHWQGKNFLLAGWHRRDGAAELGFTELPARMLVPP